MIHPSLFLRRAIQADAIFSGVSAVLLTLGAADLAALLNLPEALLRETGLFLVAYAALVAWLGTRATMPRALVIIVIAGNSAWTVASIALLFIDAVMPNLLGQAAIAMQAIVVGALRTAIYRLAPEQRGRDRLVVRFQSTSPRLAVPRPPRRSRASRKLWASRRPLLLPRPRNGRARSGRSRSEGRRGQACR